MIQWFVEALIFSASCHYLRDLAQGRSRNEWGYEVLVYWPEVEEVIRLWNERQQEDERIETLRVWEAIQGLERQSEAAVN